VTKNFSQTYNIDYENIFTLIIKFNTFQVFLVIIALKNLEYHSVNVNNIFIKFFLKKTIYITFFSEINITSNYILHILHSLYDFKQITQNWYEQYVIELIKLNFYQNSTDLCFFLYSIKKIMLLFYVNDIVVISTNLLYVYWFKQALVHVFKVKNLKKMKKILDIQVTYNHKWRTLHLNQIHYVNKILKNLYIQFNKHRAIIISLNKYDVLCSVHLNDQRIDQRQY